MPPWLRLHPPFPSSPQSPHLHGIARGGEESTQQSRAGGWGWQGHRPGATRCLGLDTNIDRAGDHILASPQCPGLEMYQIPNSMLVHPNL